MRLPRVRFTVRLMMVATLAIGMELGWIVWWEQLRVQGQRASARQMLTEAAHEHFPSDYSGYASQQEMIEASNRVEATARMWAEGWPSLHVITFGLIVVFGVVGLALVINKAVTQNIRQRRRESERHQIP